MTDPIISTARSLYASSVVNPHKGRSHIWNGTSPNHEVLTRIIDTCETPEAVEKELDKTDLYAISIPDPATKELMLKWFKTTYPNDPEQLTPNSARMLQICKSVQSKMNIYDSRIIELGGGNGQLAAKLKSFGCKTHVDIDIPESLYMAYVCTRARFPLAKCVWITPETPSDTIVLGEYDFVFCPVQMGFIFEGKSFDLFINTASMGEMPNEQINFWINYVQQHILVRYFYGLNRFLNTIETKNLSDYSEHRKNENCASVLFDENWDVLLWELEPLFCRCPFQDPKIARYLEVMLERLTKPDLDSSYMAELGMQDWWRYKDVNPLGTHRSNQLVHDFTVTGPLFYLWNTLRISRSRGAVDMMLTYLQWIGKDNLMFEEEVYYQSLKAKL